MKCIMCGKEAKFESLKMVSPVCEDCAKEIAKMYRKNHDELKGVSLDDVIEEIYVPFAGDVTKLRQSKG